MNWNDIEVFSELFPATERADAEGTAESTFGKPNHQDEPVDDDDSIDGNDANSTAKLDEQVDNEREQWDEELFGGLSGLARQSLTFSA